MKTSLSTTVALGLAAWLAATLTAQQTTNEELPRRQFDSGRSFMQGGRYAEALKDFQAVVDSFPRSSVADNALLEIALYHLDIAHDANAAQGAVDKLLKEYADTDAAPMGYVVSGRLAMTKGRAASNVDTALASFERVPRLFPGNDAVPAAGFYAGETLRLARRTEEALDRYRNVTAQFPNSPWAAQANLAAGYCLVQGERASSALPEVQRVRQQQPGTPAAAEALNLNTIMYRLYVRGVGQPAYGFSGRFIGEERANYNDVVGIIIDSSNRLLLGHKNGVAIFDTKGPLKGTVMGNEPSAFFVDERNRVILARNDVLIADRAESQTITTPEKEPGKTRPVEEIPSVVAMSSGQRIIMDRKAKNLIRVGVDGRYIGNYLTNVNGEKLALNRLDDVAVIERDSKAITIADRDGKVLTKIAAKGANYQFDEPIDLTFDQLGHLYVLDRGKGSVYVFNPKYKLISTFTIAQNNPGSFAKAKAMAVDAAGRLYIFDERVKRIQVYQ
jgi:TolA-binding protein